MTFLASVYLWLLPLVSIPIIFHLLKKRNYKKIDFSSLYFFNSLEDSAIKKNNLINILLLIIRTLILLMLILIISKPVIKGTSRNVNSSYRDICIIVFDNSYSNSSHINQNYNKILKDILQEYGENTLIQVANMNDNKFTINDFKKNITELTISDNISYSPIYINELKKYFTNNDFSKYDNKDFYFISDFQNNILNNKIDFIDDSWNKFLYKNNQNNETYFSSFSLEPDFVNINDLLTINIKINNNNDNPIEGDEVLLYIDDVIVGSNSVFINPYDSKKYSFKTSINTYGYHKCYFKLNSIEYYFIINIPDMINVGIIDNGDNSKYLVNGLIAFNEISENINYYKYNSEEFKTINSRYDALIIFGLENLTISMLSNISHKTNNLIVIPTTNLNIDNIQSFYNIPYSKNKNNKLIQLGSGYIKLNQSFSNENPLRNILEVEDIKFYEYYKLTSSANTIVKYENDLSFVNRYINKDLILTLLTTPMNIKSTNFPLNSSFMPFINETIIKSINKINYNAGDNINVNQFSSYLNLEYIENKSISNFQVSNIIDDGILLLKPGFHQIIVEDNKVEYSSNIPLIEIDDTIASNEVLEKYFGEFTIVNNLQDLNTLLSNQVSGLQLWRYFLWLLALLIIFEMFISNIYAYKND